MNILIVDDDVDLRETLESLLQLEGYAVISASSGNQAIEFIEKGLPVKLIVSDYYMDDGNGVDLLRYVTSRPKPTIPFLLMTGQAPLTAEEVKKMGAQGYFLKPFDIKKFLKTIADYYQNNQTSI